MGGSQAHCALVTRPERDRSREFQRRQQLFARAAPLFREHGYRATTLKAVAKACGLSIPALYRYFPSKKALALFPLVALYPELHGPAPDLTGDPRAILGAWVEAASREMPNVVLALVLSRDAGLDERERRTMDANLEAHVGLLAGIAQRAAPELSERSARDLAAAMINVAVGPAAGGREPDPAALRRQLKRLLRGYGVTLPR